MDIASNSWGICITCMHRSYCLSFRNGLQAARPIWDCDEYEHNDTCVADLLSRAHEAQERNDENPSNDGMRERTIGLCINCANQNSCMLPIPKGGLWHCEEYC